MILENEKLLVEIAEDGAELTRIYHKERGTELLWNADEKYWKRHAPILFPTVGKLYGGVTRIGGKEYAFPQHGFARDMRFDKVTHTATEGILVLKANEASKALYPFDFELEIGYTLCGGNLRVSWKVTNHSAEPMPFTIGAHPGFLLDGGKGRKEDFCVELPGKQSLTYILLDPSCGCGMPEKNYELTLDGGYLPLSEELFAKDALVVDGCQIEEAWLCDAQHNRLVGVKSPDFPQYGIWAAKGAPFVCLEPWAGRADDVGYQGELGDKPGATVLAQGGVFTKAYDIVTE